MQTHFVRHTKADLRLRHPGSLTPEPLHAPSARRDDFTLPQTNNNRGKYVVDPALIDRMAFPPIARQAPISEPSRNTEPVLASGIDNDLRSKWVSGLIYTPHFIEEERERAKRNLTIAIDLDKTLGRGSELDPSNLLPAWMMEDETWILRPNIDDVLQGWQQRGIRLVLWTGADRARVTSFFEQFPHMIELFDKIISKENFAAAHLALYGQEHRLVSQIAGVPIQHVLRQMDGSEYTPKWVSLLGHWGLIDDYDGLEGMRQKSPFGTFEVRQVTPLPRGFSRNHPLATRINSELYQLDLEITSLFESNRPT